MVIDAQPRHRDRWQPSGKRETTQDYYVVRKSMPACPHALDYWAPKFDPDGILRNRDCEAERLQYVRDTCDEISYVNDLKPERVLDFGAGLGWFLQEIDAEEHTAIETSSFAFAVLWNSWLAHIYTDTRLVRDQTQDVVVCHHVIEHLSDPIAAILEMRRVLRPGGHLVLGTPDFGSACAERFGPNYRMLHDPTHISLFTLESMHRFLRDHGFTILDVAFPFPDRYNQRETWERWSDPTKISPPWPGNWMTFYCQR